VEKKGRERKEEREGERDRFGAEGGRQKGGRGTERGRDDENRKKRGEESWNRAADWLRPALGEVCCGN